MHPFFMQDSNAPFPESRIWHIELEPDDFSPAEAREKRVKRFDSWFTEAEAAEVEAMALCPGFYYGRRAGRDMRFADLTMFPKLEWLSVPVHLLAYVDLAGVATRLRHLEITDAQSFSAGASGKGAVWRMPRTLLPALRSLRLFCPPGALEHFSLHRFPALEWFSCALGSERAGFIADLEKLPRLKGLGLADIRSTKTRLGSLPGTVQALTWRTSRPGALTSDSSPA